MARMKDFYKAEVAPALMKKFGLQERDADSQAGQNRHQRGRRRGQGKRQGIDSISGDLAKITGQKPVVCKAKKSVANFKLREGMPIGVKVTLRGERMYEFLDRLFQRGPAPACATSGASTPIPLTAVATTTWVSASS